MKYSKFKLWAVVWTIAFLLIGLGAGVAWADVTNTNNGMNAPSLNAPALSLNYSQLLTPLIVPVLISFGKKLANDMPGWLIVIVAPGIGFLIDVVSHYATGAAMNPTLALLLGAAGIGLRELKDQVGKRIAAGSLSGCMSTTALMLACLWLMGCAHARDGSKTFHRMEAYGVMAPEGWTIVKPNITNSATSNAVASFDVIAPSGTNQPGFFARLINRPKVYVAYREEWKDTSSGGGTFVFTDPNATQLAFTRTNQSGLGGSRTVSVGQLQSTITSNAVSAISAGGDAVGKIIGAAANAAATGK